MTPALLNLLAISSDAICPSSPDMEDMAIIFEHSRTIFEELKTLLATRNGFWAYESSLLVRPFRHDVVPLGILEWNDKQLWKGEYNVNLERILFFAEDVFGCQYCLSDNKVKVFDPETGELEEIAKSLEEWAGIILKDYQFRTGYPLAHAWQMQNYPLPPGSRLLPNVSFVLGGKYELQNLHIGNDAEGMVFRASIANQIQDVDDGGQIMLEVVNKKKH